MRKRGEQSIGITIAIVVGVILLVLLVFGVTDVWGVFRGETGVITGSNSNIDDLVDACDLRCTGADTYAYCIESREIIINDKVSAKGSCKTFEDNLASYGFKGCSSVSCGTNAPKLTNQAGEVVTFSGGNFVKVENSNP